MYRGCTNAMQLWLGVDYRCPRYRRRVSKQRGKRKGGGWWRWERVWFVHGYLAPVVEEKMMSESQESMNRGSEMWGWRLNKLNVWLMVADGCSDTAVSALIQAWIQEDPYSGNLAAWSTFLFSHQVCHQHKSTNGPVHMDMWYHDRKLTRRAKHEQCQGCAYLSMIHWLPQIHSHLGKGHCTKWEQLGFAHIASHQCHWDHWEHGKLQWQIYEHGSFHEI